MPEKSIIEMSMIELKATAYDEISKIEAIQINLRNFNAEIARRMNGEKPESNIKIQEVEK